MKSLLFATGLCVVCSLLLTAASTGLKPLQQRNSALDRQRNVLLALDVVDERSALKADEIEQLFHEHVRRIQVDREGRVVSAKQMEQDQGPGDGLPLYLYIRNNRLQAYVLPVVSPGLWGRIDAYLAINDDGATVRGFTVFQHQETPGLGGEIENRGFRENFKGKKIVDQNGAPVALRVAKGKVEEVVPPGSRSHYVDGISGATLTGNFLSQGLQQTLSRYAPVSERFRQNQIQPYLQKVNDHARTNRNHAL